MRRIEPETDYEKDLVVDKYKLDEECVRQPMLYMKYAKLAAEAKKQFDYAWERAKVTRAKLIKEAKGTAQEKEAFFRDHPDHKKAVRAKNDAEAEYNILNAASYALSQRKTMLEMLVKLWGGEYFSTPVPERVPRKKMEEEKSRKARSKIRTKKRK